jgi:hypothetical protein
MTLTTSKRSSILLEGEIAPALAALGRRGLLVEPTAAT